MHDRVEHWMRDVVKRHHSELLEGKRVLECGSHQGENGGARQFFTKCDYTGLDAQDGPGVNVQSLVHEYKPRKLFEVIVSLQMLEHDPYWRASLRRMVQMLAPGGALILTWAGPGWPIHDTHDSPQAGYYENRTAEEVVNAIGAGNFKTIELYKRHTDRHLLALGKDEAKEGGQVRVFNMLARYQQQCEEWSDIKAHLRILFARAKGTVLELGTRGGVSTKALLAGVARRGGHVWSVDVDPACGTLFHHPQWTFVHADSRDRVALANAGLPGGIDLLFLDTKHNYEQVKSELDVWGELVKPGGCILAHDTDLNPGARRAVSEWAERYDLQAWFRPESNGLGVVNIPPYPVRVAAILPNLNMGKAADALVERARLTSIPLDLIVVDDGSKPDGVSKYTTLVLAHQLRPNRARLMGLHYADYIERQVCVPYSYYWLLATSAQFTENNPPDILWELVQFMESNPDAVCVLPAYSPDSGAPWQKTLGDRGTGQPRQVKAVELVASLHRAGSFNANGRLNPDSALGWGTDLELAYKASLQGGTLWVHEGLQIRKDYRAAHQQGQRKRTVSEYWQDADKEQNRIFEMAYGPNWRDLLA